MNRALFHALAAFWGVLLWGSASFAEPAALDQPAQATRRWMGIIVHVSDSTHMTHAECDAWHRERGWQSCGYNFVIERDGAIYEARGFDTRGAHAKGYNSKWLGVCFVGEDIPTHEQMETFHAWRRQHGLESLPIKAHARVNQYKVCGLSVEKQILHPVRS